MPIVVGTTTKHAQSYVIFSAQFPAVQMNAATQFLATWPETTFFHITILTEDGRPLVNKAAGLEEIRQHLVSWLALQRAHFFMRPNLRSSIFLDLDQFKGP